MLTTLQGRRFRNVAGLYYLREGSTFTSNFFESLWGKMTKGLMRRTQCRKL